MPVKIIHHLLNVVGGSQEQKAKKEGDGEVMQVYRKDMCERKTKRLCISGRGRSGLQQSRTGDHIQMWNSLSFLSTCPSQSSLCGFIMSENINSPPKK